MRTVELDDDLFNALEVVSNFVNTPVPQLLRQIVMDRIQPKPTASKPIATVRGQSYAPAQPSARDKKLRDHSRSPGFLASRSVMDQFLNLLSFLYSENIDNFAILESMEGRRRKYIARSAEELESSGNSVNPKKIPSTQYWAVTNNSTDNKKVLLRQALTLLGYDSDTIRLVPECLR